MADKEIISKYANSVFTDTLYSEIKFYCFRSNLSYIEIYEKNIIIGIQKDTPSDEMNRIEERSFSISYLWLGYNQIIIPECIALAETLIEKLGNEYEVYYKNTLSETDDPIVYVKLKNRKRHEGEKYE